ncbi:CCR4-NOT core subunit cdc39 [Coemansia sp. RSA 552]|nr:CCR4-NOT core subunit cdc39 [Coemansia sp. RSA 552]
MGLAEQFMRAGPQASATDVISKYAQQQHHNNTKQAGGSDAAKRNGVSDGSEQPVGGLTVDDVARAMALIASNAGDNSDASSWKADEFAAGIAKHCPGLSWEDVIYKLPYSNLSVRHESGAAFIVNVFLAATAGQNRPFPYSFMYEIWPDAPAQVSFLRCTLRSSAVAPYMLDKHMPAIQADPLETLYKVYHPEFTRMLGSPWNSLSLILVLSHLLDSKASDDAYALLDTGIRQEPLLVTLALARLKIQHLRLQALLQHNVTRFLRREFGHSGLFFELFRLCEKKMMVAFFCSLHRKDPTITRRILDVLVDLGLAADMLLAPKREDIAMLDFTVELAVFASRRGIIVFETWFPGLLAELGSDMLHASLEILHAKLQLEAARQRGEDKGAAAYSSGELTTMFNALGVVAMSPNNAANLKALYTQFAELAGPLGRMETDGSGDDGQIEKDAESLFLRLYRGEMSVDQMADTLEDLRDSLQTQRRQTYAHVIQYPLEEFAFFDNYPDKELTITGQLVGALVQQQMLPPASEAAILEMVIKALEAGPATKSFRFGMTALDACQGRIEQLPVFCTRIYHIAAFRQSNTAAATLVQAIIAAAMPGRNARAGGSSRGAAGGAGLGRATPMGGDVAGAVGLSAEESQLVFRSVQPPALAALGVPHGEPAEETKDKIQFAVNNMARSNLEEKTGEVNRELQAEFFVWFSREVVVKRASQEPNYHALYQQFIEALGRPQLTRCVLRETLVSIARLLNAESTIHSSRDRGYLKNLGAWLGGMTLARDQPILRENVSFKELLCEGYQAKRLIVAIPFVCKVLEQAARSTVFHAPSPWLMGIMGVLAELYATADLKLNLTFEIEVLCKALNLDVKEIQASAVLGTVDLEAGLARASLESPSHVTPAGASAGAGSSAVTGSVPTDIAVDVLGVLGQHASFQAAGGLFAQQPTLRKMFFMLTERMIREIIPVHVGRAVQVAVVCTRDTVQKDFGGESNEEHVHRAAQVMARGVAGALAVSLSREQLKSKLYLTMREFLMGHGLAEGAANTVAVGLVADNLDLACAIAEKEAIERASQQIDTELGEAYASRRGSRGAFYDAGRVGRLAYPAGFPDVLRVRHGGVAAGHLQIYEDFTQIPHFFSQIGSGEADQDEAAAAAAAAAGQSMERLVAVVGELDAAIAAAGPGVSLAQLPAQHAACQRARDVLVLAALAAQSDTTALDFAQALVGRVYAAATRLGVDVYVLLLARMCELSTRVAREVASWLAHADDARKFNVAATEGLLREGLVSAHDEDARLSRLVEAGRAGAAAYAVRLVRRIRQGGQPDAFPRTAQSLARVGADSEGGLGNGEVGTEAQGTEAHNNDASYQLMLLNWTRVHDHPAAGAGELTALARQLQQQITLSDTRVAAAFFRAGVDAALAAYEEAASQADQADQQEYRVADALVVLVACLARAGSGLQPVRMFLASVVLVAGHVHAQRPAAGALQRPLVRLLSGLLSEAHTASRNGEAWADEVFGLVAEALEIMDPATMPGFSFAWLMVAAHRFLLPRLAGAREHWAAAAGLLERPLRLLQPFAAQGQLRGALKLLYRGTVCVVLVVLHDFPDFLAAHALRLSAAVPPSCVQLRNLLLSAYPRAMRLPEPLAPGLDIARLPAATKAPEIAGEPELPAGVRNMLDRTLAQTQALDEAVAQLLPQLHSSDPAAADHGPIHRVVQYVVAGAAGGDEAAQRAALGLVSGLAGGADAEGRYVVVGAVADHLRYPSSHTLLASRVVLALFADGSEAVREAIARVLVERILVNRPFPWGLLVTLIELLRNPFYAFWSHAFTRASPQIADILAAVAKSIRREETASPASP